MADPADLRGNLLYFWSDQWCGGGLLKCTGFYRYSGYADDHLRDQSGLYKVGSARRLPYRLYRDCQW